MAMSKKLSPKTNSKRSAGRVKKSEPANQRSFSSTFHKALDRVKHMTSRISADDQRS